MEVDPGPYDLDETRVILGPGGDATAKVVTPNFYAELDAEFDGFKGHVLVSRHEFSEAWGMWEVHPLGDEIVYLISGDVDFVLWTLEGEKTVRVNRPGSCVVVPKGVWHTARPNAPTAMLFITPGEGTQNAEAPTAFAWRGRSQRRGRPTLEHPVLLRKTCVAFVSKLGKARDFRL